MITTLLAALALQQSAFVHSKTGEYSKFEVQGFTVYASPAVMADKQRAEQALALLQSKLEEIERVVPGDAFAKIHTVKIWIERDNPDNLGAVYHPSVEWLRQNGYNLDKAKSVEVGNVKNFLEWAVKTQPMMILHELAHAYHDQVLGYGDKTIKAAFDHAVESKTYESVMFVSGGEKKAYALTNVMEYFAECSEAYFGMNDFYPFNRWQLLSFDEQAYRALVGAWGLPKGQSMVIGSLATTEVLKSVGRYRG